jgi:hypothetical protein
MILERLNELIDKTKKNGVTLEYIPTLINKYSESIEKISAIKNQIDTIPEFKNIEKLKKEVEKYRYFIPLKTLKKIDDLFTKNYENVEEYKKQYIFGLYLLMLQTSELKNSKQEDIKQNIRELFYKLDNFIYNEFKGDQILIQTRDHVTELINNSLSTFFKIEWPKEETSFDSKKHEDVSANNGNKIKEIQTAIVYSNQKAIINKAKVVTG